MHQKAAVYALAFIILFNLILYDTAPGISVFIFFALLNTYWYLTRERTSPNQNWGTIHAVLSTIAAATFCFRDNDIIQFLDFALAASTSTLAAYLYRTTHTFNFSLQETLLIPFNTLLTGYDTTKQIIQNKDTLNTEGRVIVTIIRGVIIAVVLVVILTLLLYSADPIFARYVRDFFESFTGRAISSIILFIGLYIGGTSIVKYQKAASITDQTIKHKPTELYIINTAIAILLAVFAIIQIRYVFVSVTPSDFERLGIPALTYSDYVRRGFFELLFASGIVCAVILYTLKYLHHFTPKAKLINQALVTIISAEAFLLIISAGKRLSEYAIRNGLTRTRIIGIVVLIALLLYLTLFLIKTYKNIHHKQTYFANLAIIFFSFLTLNIINVDHLTAKTFRPTVNNEVDYYYIAHLSADAHTAWPDIINYAQRTADEAMNQQNISQETYRKVFWARNAIHTLEWQTNHLKYMYGNEREMTGTSATFLGEATELKNLRRWPSHNLSQYQAYQFITQNKVTFDQIPVLKTAFDTIDNRTPNNVKQHIYYDRVSDPLFL